MTVRMTKGVPQAKRTVAVEPTIDMENVARAIASALASLPPRTPSVLSMTVMAADMPSSARLRRSACLVGALGTLEA